MKRNIFVALATTLFTTPLQASEQLPEMVITADRIAQDEATVSADTSVITRQEIEQSQATSVADVLRSQAGIHVVSSGGAGKATSVFLRGGNSGHTLVLIDGVRVGSATLGSFDWANLSTAGIERIEIVRGAQSSLYGADAMAGVIQIFTRKATDSTKVHVSGEAGAYGTSSGRMSITGKTDAHIGYALTVDGLRTDSVSAAASGKEADPYRQATLSGQLTLPVGDGELALVTRNVDGTTSLDGFGLTGPVDALNYSSNTKQTVNSVKLTYPFNDIFESSLQLSRSTDEVTGRDPATSFNNSDFRTRIDQLTWNNHMDFDQLSLLAGVDAYRSQGNSGSAGLNNSIAQTAAFAALAWNTDWADINASLRYDQNSVTINKTTYKAGVALHPLDSLKISANYGTGFKAPSLNDLYFPASAFSAGNAHLKPESSKGWDVGLSWQLDQASIKSGLSLTWFDQTYRNLIVWQASPTFFYSPANIGRARTQGMEISANASYQHVYLRANWTYLKAQDSTTNTMLPRRAKESGNVIMGTELAGLHAELAWRVTGPRFSATGNKKYMKGYQTTSIRLHYTINERWQLHARVDNAGNSKYEEVAGYGVPGRAWYAGLSADL